MITSLDFDNLVYPPPRLKDTKPILSNILGIDSEAYGVDAEGHRRGEPFVFCLSNGDTLLPRDIPAALIDDYSSVNFMIYNIKYDSGALLYHLPQETLKTLWEDGKAVHDGYHYQYIPHKQLKISQGRSSVVFWDISQFYHAPLDKAARKYLGRGKIDIRTKRFSPKYVRHFWKYIVKYCVMDARLTEELGRYLVDKLREFGITASSLYSCASISFKYFCDRSRVVTTWRYWQNERDVVAFACDAYEGGKFEVTWRGAFSGHEYDITSAYPYEIANLVDISNASVVRSPHYRRDAVYGFLRCSIRNPDGKYMPCGPQFKNVRIYPAGRFFLTITKAEYEYLLSIGIDVDVHDAIWLHVERKVRPYRKVIDTLFEIKADHKGKDEMLYYVSKIVMNSFYGKCVQCTDMIDGRIKVGPGFNPVYGAVITANTRLKVTKIQNLLGDDCLAVHTDSVITRTPLPKHLVKNRLGEFEHVVSGDGIIVACGMYQINDISKFKGFIPLYGEDWKTLLQKYRHRKSIPYPQLKVESWLEAMAKNHDKSSVNVFERVKKNVDLNCDTKRIWPTRRKAREFLEGGEYSYPKISIEREPPKHWA